MNKLIGWLAVCATTTIVHAQGTSGIIDMAAIPGGTFRMGDMTGVGLHDEQPVHEVTITRSFLMGIVEVTQAQWKAVMATNPSYFKGDSLPVENISWFDAVDFCNRLSILEELEPCYSGKGEQITCNFEARGYRLPTEAEWEYACKAGTESEFHTGALDRTAGNQGALQRAGWYQANSGARTNNVASKRPNRFGLHDVHGNVWEWCWDWYSGNYYTSQLVVDPRGPATAQISRIVRGGAWSHNSFFSRSTMRAFVDPDASFNCVGFRVVRRM